MYKLYTTYIPVLSVFLFRCGLRWTKNRAAKVAEAAKAVEERRWRRERDLQGLEVQVPWQRSFSFRRETKHAWFLF